MMNSVDPMASLRERLKSLAELFFPWMWRLALLALPWQTRVFQEGPMVGGYPWEEGRISLYGSEILMAFTIGLSIFVHLHEKRLPEGKQENTNTWFRRGLCILFVLVTCFTTTSLRSTAEWWIEVGMLALFSWTLARRVSLQDLSFWVTLSLIPHAFLGVWQVISQRVFGAPLLGIAAQNPLTPGVSVIEVGGNRWLRAYGGFPHPNIFGGWLVVGIALVYQSLKENMFARKEKIFYYFTLVLFSSTLIFSYSRSAWVALGLFLVISFGRLVFHKVLVNRKTQVIALLLIFASCVVAVYMRPSLVFSRAQTGTRLERKSLDERAEGFKNAFRIVRVHPLFGSGLGASEWVLSGMNMKDNVSASIPIPPHAVPLLALAEIGIIGSIFLVYIVGRSFHGKRALLNLAPFLPIVFLDHYLWSYWGGKVLFIFICFFFLQETSKRRCEM